MPATPEQPLPVYELAVATGVDEQSADWRGLKIFLRQTKTFRLALALYNDLVARDAAIRSLHDELAGQGVRVLTLNLRESSSEHTLLGRVNAAVKSAELSSGEQLVVMVVNLEGQVDYAPELAQPGSPGMAFLETANLQRELFPNACLGPLVIWTTELLERALVQHSPDLWHWRSHVFDLRTRTIPPDSLVSAERNAWSNDDFRRHPEDRLRRLEEELVAYRRIDSPFDEGRILNAMGIAKLDASMARGAIHCFEMARKIARKLNDRHNEGIALGNLGLAYNALGETNRALELYEQQLSISRELGNRRGEGSALSRLGNVYKDLGEPHRAIEYHEQHRAVARELGDRHGEEIAIGNLGSAYAATGEFHKAIEFYEQALAIDRELGDLRGTGADLGNLGNVYFDLGEIWRAIGLYEQQLAIAQQIGDRHGESGALWNSANSFAALGDYVEAIRRAEQSLSIKESTDDPLAETVRLYLSKWRERGGNVFS